MIFKIHFLEEANADLSKLNKNDSKIILKKLNWLALNVKTAKHLPLSANLAGLYKLRVGDFRVIYQILEKESILLVHAVGHRKDIYDI